MDSSMVYAIIGLAVLVVILFAVLRHVRQKNENLYYEKRELEDTVYQMQQEIVSNSHKISSLRNQNDSLSRERAQHEENLRQLLSSNLTSIPWLAGMIADFLTYDLEIEAKKLDWGRNVQREKKVASIRLLRADAERRIEEAKEAIYQLEYLRALFPGIDDVLSVDYRELQLDGQIPDHDPVMDYLTKDEWQRLSEIEKSQLALDRYVAFRKKSKWQIGRDYELSVAYEYRRKGYLVETYGSYMGLEDLGRDLIAKKSGITLIIQCKYWSQSKKIHEKHLYQLYGTTIGYCIEKNVPQAAVKPVFVTNIELSDTAQTVADYLGISYLENHEMTDFPRIKCNIGRDEYGPTKIFHLPMDRQYDVTKIEKTGEFYAFTVEEAVRAGFRRAFKWYGTS